MKIQRIYLDTNVIGGCFDVEFAPWSEGLFKDFELGFYRPVVSDLVAAEIAKGPQDVRDKFAELLAMDPEMIERSPAAESLAQLYVQRGILSQNYENDALHIAMATVANVDVLTSWNFKHVVHLDKIRLFQAANLELGYRPIQIYSPREVTHYGIQNG